MDVPYRQIRAHFDDDAITVYQAYRAEIAISAAKNGKFPPAFKRERMTWIKPSFLWMMYRSGWAKKPGQEHVLAISIIREGFEWALWNSAFAHFDPAVHADDAQWKASLSAPVRIQWDPERNTKFSPLPHRSLQVGLSGEAVRRYCDEWIVGIEDVTGLAHEIDGLVTSGDTEKAYEILPKENPYPVSKELAAHLGISGG
ncbi:DUF4291 domain-containing protein [Nocardia sp. BMG51109]|uniref:DUF4291 domain-containing protein n=1 Tax=Nocardia sp. BMG51109 TaxID=1056816 RepID=UPI000464C963|nr:DUF4291 domain-containing protein [Nocardia sp. BMG51109]